LGYEGFLAGYAEGNGFDGGDDNVNEKPQHWSLPGWR
jgi:hypothetical protein